MKIYGACACNIDWQLPKQLVVTRDGHPIFERTNIVRRKKFVHEKWYPSEKTNDGRTTWIVHRDEKIIVVLKTNQKKQKKDFIDQMLFMNKCFYWTNDFTNVSNFAQHLTILCVEYIDGQNAIFLIFDHFFGHFKGLFWPFKKKTFLILILLLTKRQLF